MQREKGWWPRDQVGKKAMLPQVFGTGTIGDGGMRFGDGFFFLPFFRGWQGTTIKKIRKILKYKEIFI